ncbi:MAG: 50S ribosome-binding GTPase [Candidatus Woesearchaeota archaeon]|jgi:ribosome-interacting GTPase 1|nr:50S ribosome-binding GTPase [Candidatus Woesearchaeota archaeon]
MAHEELKERIEELEAELKGTKVNKKTEMAVGQLKSKIAKIKEELEVKLSKGKSVGDGFAVKKEGDATVGLLGKPSVGKSTLLGKITNKKSKIGAYEFTTLDVVPGLLHFKHTNLQILDLPGIIERAADNRGFGKKVLSVVRACDLVIFVIDVKDPLGEIKMLLDETYKSGIRFNQREPFIEIKRAFNGGISVPLNNSSDNIPYSLIEEVMHDMKYTNAEIIIHEKNLNVDDFIDACYGNLVYKKAVFCLNKIDLFDVDTIKGMVDEIKEKYPQFSLIGISADADINLDKFKDFMWDQLGFIWVYLKELKKEPDMQRPLVVRKGDTVERVCNKIHKDVLDKFKHARIKGSSAKFNWQRVGLDHVVKDKDIIEIFAR